MKNKAGRKTTSIPFRKKFPLNTIPLNPQYPHPLTTYKNLKYRLLLKSSLLKYANFP